MNTELMSTPPPPIPTWAIITISIITLAVLVALVIVDALMARRDAEQIEHDNALRVETERHAERRRAA